MSDEAAKYHLWHPHYEVNDQKLTCTVDVVPVDGDLLDQGGPDLIAQPDLAFLSGLSTTPRVTEVVTWRGLMAPVSQVRVALGVLPLPERRGDVFEVVHACHREAYVVHCEDSYALFV